MAKLTVPIKVKLPDDWKEQILERIKQDDDWVCVVRCRECIHCADDWNGNQPMFTCELGKCGESVQPDDYCSYGEEKEME